MKQKTRLVLKKPHLHEGYLFYSDSSLRTKGMSELKGKWITVCYEHDEAAARNVFEYADSERCTTNGRNI